MYKINEFAKVVNTSTNTLRFYEKKGIFIPAYRNEKTGYRYYAEEQILEFFNLTDLKRFHLSIEEIHNWKKGLLTEDNLEEKLQKEVSDLNALINKLNIIIKAKKQEKVFEIKEYDTYTLQKELHNCSIGQLENEIINLNIYLQNTNLQIASSSFCFVEFLFEEFQLDIFDCTVHIPIIDASLTETDITSFNKHNNPLKIELFPAAKYICIYHKDDYSTLANSYQLLIEYANKNNYTITGHPIERYIKYYQNINQQLITEIRFKVE